MPQDVTTSQPSSFGDQAVVRPTVEDAENDASSSAQQPLNDLPCQALYTSLFSLYPTLTSQPHESHTAKSSGLDAPLQISSLRSTSSFFIDDSLDSHFPSRPRTPDLKQLRLSVISKNLDPSKRICRFEVPGGGICRDEGCEDIHLSRISGQKGLEPTDEDTARFLVNALPANWLTHHNATYARLHSVLRQIRSKASDLALEQRVAAALATFGPS